MKIKNLRWIILSLIALVTIINYLDRGTLNYMWVANVTSKYEITQDFTPGMSNVAVIDQTGTLYQLYDKNGKASAIVPITDTAILEDGQISYTKRGGIAKDLGFVDTTLDEATQNKQAKEYLALITMCFMVAYGISQLVSGKVYDKIGTRRGFAISVIIWGLSDAFASMSTGIKSLSFFRVTLGLGEAGPWPGTTKSNAEWFPTKERAFAQGVFGASASVGSVIAPVIIPLLYLYSGWHVTFIIVGSLGLLWVISSSIDSMR
ncbi:MAG: MFS transporter [Bacteroidaceae bacterium]